MLHQLSIHNFAIVDRLEITWVSGLNVITGETGAGKSILVDAVGALLGDRVGAEVVRTGAARATVEGVFDLGPAPRPAIAVLLDEYGLEADEGVLIVTRDVAAAGGRGGARVNGRMVPLTALQQLGELLVEIHGQSQHMSLMRVREHLEYLDRYAGLQPQRARVAALVRELRGVREEMQAIRGRERDAAREQALLRHQVEEIERAVLREGEEEALQAQRMRLHNVEKLRQAAMAAHRALAGADSSSGEQPGAIDLLGEAASACLEGGRFDAALAAEAEHVASAQAVAEESARALRSYLEGMDADPAEMERTEERLFLLSDLKRKYGENIPEVLRYLGEVRGRLEEHEHRDERLAHVSESERGLLAALTEAAGALSRARGSAAEQLARAVERELGELRMAGTRFRVSMQHEDDASGVEVDGRRLAFDLTGVDRVEFLIAPNAGEEPRPLARIASGGELARISLALTTILSEADTRPTLIFDEVDAGIGGRVAPVVGEKLWKLAASGHQVLCVTHMPQIAAYADQHWAVAKRAEADDGRARTRVDALDPPRQEEELAAMLGGAVSASTRASARELVARAAQTKHAEGNPAARRSAG